MKVQVINKSNNKLPEYSTIGSAGLDLHANLENTRNLKGTYYTINPGGTVLDTITIYPGGRVLIPTGLYVALPEGTHLDIRPRSGLALKQGLTVINSPGLVDSDYRNEIGVVLINHGKENQTISHGDRIAQAVLMKYEKIEWEQVENLDDTNRGLGGFGSTGK
jgi:dUTP pyrophosphatase